MADSRGKVRSSVQINRNRWLASNALDQEQDRLRRAEATCRRIARGHYENFIVASVLLPRQMRQAFFNVYAFCRHADDLADLSTSPAEALRSLDAWQAGLDRCFAGQADHPVFIALGDTVRRFGLPRRPFDDLIDAFRQDQRKTRYADFDELLDYCRRSANPVGRIVLRLAEADTPPGRRLADSICTGLQLANHWQDLARDYRSGRVYLPQDALAAAGIGDEVIAQPSASAALRRVVADQCQRARDYLVAGLPLAESVPRWLAVDIKLFVHGGLATLDRIAALDHDTLRVRPKVSRMRQLWMLGRAICGRL